MTDTAPPDDPPAENAPAENATPQSLDAALDLLNAPPTERVRGVAVTTTGRSPGTAPSLLLIHGVGASRVVWAPVVPALAERYHVIAVDLPGHGASDPLTGSPRCAALALDLAAVCADLGVYRPHVVGNSLGGWIGLELAADGCAASLVGLAPAGLRVSPVTPSPLFAANRRLARLAAPVAAPVLRWRLPRTVAFATGSAAPGRLHPGVAAAMAEALARATAYETMLQATAHCRFERRDLVQVPTAIVFGDRDLILPPPNQRRELAPPTARWLRWAHCGHAPMWDAPEQTVQLIHETVLLGSGAARAVGT